MLFEVDCFQNYSRLIKILKKWRFHQVKEKSKKVVLFRRYINYADELLDSCYIGKNGQILTKNDIGNEQYNNLRHRIAIGKCNCELAFIPKGGGGVILLQELLVCGGCVLRIYDDGIPEKFKTEVLVSNALEAKDLVFRINTNYKIKGA